MKKFIIFFIVFVLLLGYVIGQCDGMIEPESSNEEILFLSDQKIEETEVVEEYNKTNNIDNKVYERQPNDSEYNYVKIPSTVSSQILTRKSYICSYNEETKIPNWIAWHLTADHTNGEILRDNSYYEDTDVPLPRATNEDYHRSGWSHGHMCPAGDNKWSEQAMRESNLLTNICPQDRSLNSGVWNKIEQDCRKWAKRYGDLYIVCGPILRNKEYETIGKNKVVVPEAFFKVILCLEGTPKAIGYVISNNDESKKRDEYIKTVDEVERITGYDFFPALPDDIENKVEAHADIKDW